MGNKQSVTITQQKADHNGIQGKKDEPNGHMMSGLDLTDAVTCEASVQQNTEPPLPVKVTINAKSTPVSVEANGTQAKAPAVSVEAAGTQVSATTESTEQKTSTESSTPGKDAPKQPTTSSVFNKMFKKKTEPVPPASEENQAAEALIIAAVETERQKSNLPVSVDANGPQAKAAVSVEAAGNQVSATTESTEQKMTADSSTPGKDAPKQPTTSSVFNKMFKKKTEPVPPASEENQAAEALIIAAVETESQKSNSPLSVEANGLQAKAVSGTTESTKQKITAESSTPAKDAPKQPNTPSMFNKMFKKKTGPVPPASEVNTAAEALIIAAVEAESQKSEPTDIKASTQAEKVPQGEASKPSTTEVTQDTTQPEQSGIEEKTVMNFFKTFVTSTKTTKEATASPDVSKEQVQEASKVPPPPPPAPPKMESKAEPAVKKDEAPPVEVKATAAKEQETQSKTRTKDSPFSKLFRTKALLGKKGSKGASVPAKTSSASVVIEEAKPVEIQVDASKTSTLEAGAKAEPPPAPKPEEKKADKKPSPFANLLKPKVLLGQVSSKIHAAASSAAAGISLTAGGAATEPKKEASATATAPAEAAQSTKAKEEPKPAAPAAPAAASPDSKPVGSSDNSSPSTTRKLEKRNSIQLFFKNLGQKRHSDAGVQTEPAAPEKAK
ncbi:breast carcinoma-amplified sequence 1 isoform X2 [Hemibagrus wyckioides]|uniref:breast carcinoma-amplified sequence 1 isoform X2 n=1 Tax=Hemibagrus wyckioides TaxID=337641 RepID=UPI00266C471C|nr:breast carcinoma-amplified sequence 1 isoform X2 [Hemibagrus wyckioides]